MLPASTYSNALPPLMVPLTLIHGADAKRAVCLDGTLPGYNLHPRYGSGANSWLIQLEGGGWCNTFQNCVYRKTTRHGSSTYMEKKLPFSRILSSNVEGNPEISYPSIPIRKDVGFTLKALAANTEVENSRVSINAKKIENSIVVIDNYDSFTYNLCQYMGELGCDFEVYRNDDITVEELARRNPRGILISPGPGSPQDSGISLATVLKLGPTIPVFGVCMGLQCIGEAFGGKVVRSPFGVVHGKSSLVYYNEHGEDGLFSGLPNPFTVGRYHSLVIEKENFPGDELEVTAWTDDGLIMAARHKKYRHIQGVQFHPESILTSEGRTIVGNFLKLVEKFDAESKK